MKAPLSQPRISQGNYEIPTDGILPGGRLQHFQNYWKQTFGETWATSVITTGYQIQWTSKPMPWRMRPLHLSTTDLKAADDAVEKFLTAGVIEQSPTQNRDFLSTFFTIQEETKRRPILNCQKLNTFVQCQHFKMEGIPALRELIEKGDFIAKLDLKDAYTVVPLHEDSRKFMTFDHRGVVYQYKSLPFGLSVAPRVFSKIMRTVLEPLRKEGIRLVFYLDDICVLARSKIEMEGHMKHLLSHLKALGFLINYHKSRTTPTTCQEFLGFLFNTKKMLITAPTAKLNKVLNRIRQVKKRTFSCRWIASLLGKITAMLPAVGNALLHIRYLQRDLAQSLLRGSQRWENLCPLSKESRQELQWWEEEAHKMNGLPIQMMNLTRETPKATIFTDASDSGWGITSELLTTSGHWSTEEKETSINVRELKTILFAINLHAEKVRDSHIRLFTDSITALKYVKKQGGTSSQTLQELALQIHNILLKWNITISYHHIPGVQNVAADELSRRKRPLYEGAFPKKYFAKIEEKWGKRLIDAFATRLNNKVETFWSRFPDPAASATDAFQQPWPQKGLYLHPPWKLIPRTLQYFQAQRLREAILVTPYWPTQFWFPMILRLASRPPLIFKIRRNLSLAAWRLSGRTGGRKAWRGT